MIEEPKTRNSVVLLKDGAIARRNTNSRTSAMAGAWTVYPADPIADQWQGVIDPGTVVPWVYIEHVVDRVLHEAP